MSLSKKGHSKVSVRGVSYFGLAPVLNRGNLLVMKEVISVDNLGHGGAIKEGVPCAGDAALHYEIN